jgi:hypothetical protein
MANPLHHQASLHRIIVSEFFQSLLLAPDVQVVRAPLPDTVVRVYTKKLFA